MQRSRKALLQRRALDVSGRTKKRLYKVSLSLFIVMWWLFFPILIGHSDTYRGDLDGSGVPVGEVTWNEAEQAVNEGSNSESEIRFVATDSTVLDLNTCPTSFETKCSISEPLTIKENENDPSSVKGEDKVEISKSEKNIVKNDRLSRAAPVGLDEFKSKASSPKGKPATGQSGGVVHRVEASGTEYNYASASKGAKVLAFNKEAKGAPNILGKDKDKYLRNPCSAEGKFVVIELSEETLVDSIEIANFEHYSSNLREFELLGSLVYPTDKWAELGNFTADNVKHAQRFTLKEPKWVRYLKLNLLNHYGAEFYCTLSSLGVYGVDAVEWMVEDLISVNQFGSEEQSSQQAPIPPQPEPPVQNDDNWNFDVDVGNEHGPENNIMKRDVAKNNGRNPVPDVQPQPVGRMPGDTALKILLQKVRSMDLSLSVLERYLEELNSRYGKIFKELDDEIAAKDVILEKHKEDIKNLVDSKEVIAKDLADLIGWKSLVSLQLDNLVRDNANLSHPTCETCSLFQSSVATLVRAPAIFTVALGENFRSEVERVRTNQTYMENKGLAVLLVSFICGCIAFLMIFIESVVSVLRIQKSGKFLGISSVWLVLLLSCSIVVIILL